MTLTKEHIESKIKSTSYLVLPDGRTTVCQITMENGFSVHGTSSVLNPNHFDIEIGRKVAYDDAERRIWDLEAYALMQKAHDLLNQSHKSSNEMEASWTPVPEFLEETTEEPPARKARKPKAEPVATSEEAPYGYKKDGTPKARPGRKKA